MLQIIQSDAVGDLLQQSRDFILGLVLLLPRPSFGLASRTAFLQLLLGLSGAFQRALTIIGGGALLRSASFGLLLRFHYWDSRVVAPGPVRFRGRAGLPCFQLASGWLVRV